MKVKVKYRDVKSFFEAADLAELHEKVTREFNLPETVILSLNGRDPIPSSGAFAEHDIVQGWSNYFTENYFLDFFNFF